MSSLRRPVLIAVGSATLALAGTPSAQAAGCTGRPGASALEQYCEAVPGADGSRQNPGRGNRGSGQGSSGSASQSPTVKKLAQSGKDGEKVAALVEGDPAGVDENGRKSAGDTVYGKGSGSGGGTGGASGSGDAGSAAVADPKDPSGNPLNAAKQAVVSGPTAGPKIAWALLGMSAFGAVSLLLLRRKPSGTDGAPSSSDDA